MSLHTSSIGLGQTVIMDGLYTIQPTRKGDFLVRFCQYDKGRFSSVVEAQARIAELKQKDHDHAVMMSKVDLTKLPKFDQHTKEYFEVLRSYPRNASIDFYIASDNSIRKTSF